MAKQAEIKVTEKNDELLIYRREFTEEELAHLKTTKTVFFYQSADASSMDSFKQAITSAWNLTPLLFDELSNMGNYIRNPAYSCFTIEAARKRIEFTTNGKPDNFGYNVCHYYLTLNVVREHETTGKNITNKYCRIELYPNHETAKRGENMKTNQDVMINSYLHGYFYNWKPVLLAAHLRLVAEDLKNRHRPYLFGDIKNLELQSRLSSDTLYVPKSLMINMKALGGKETMKTENVFAQYPYPYKMCSDSELYQIFEQEKRGRLLFEYTKSSSDKFVSIIDFKDGSLIYKKYTGASYNLTEQDIFLLK